MYPRLKYSILFLFFSSGLFGQGDTLFVIAQFDQASFKVRWSCADLNVLRAGTLKGWQLSLYEGANETSVQRIEIQPKSMAEIESNIISDGDSVTVEIFGQMKSGNTYFTDDEEQRWVQVALLFGLQDNFPLSRALGMGYEIFNLDSTINYRVEIELIGGGVNHYVRSPSFVHYQHPVVRPIPEAPDIECNSNRVTLTGVMINSAAHYSSFHLEKDTLDGSQYFRINTLPLMVNYAYGGPRIAFIDSIGKRATTHYRIIGKDIWGTFGPYSRPVLVDPCHINYLPPYPIIVTETQERGAIGIKWNIPDSLRHLLEGFNIYRSAHKSDGFMLYNEHLLPRDKFEFTDIDPLKVGYYLVQAVYKASVKKNSLSVVAALLDTDPPAVPNNLQANLDTATMVVTLTWDPVSDDDLKGYRVSFAHGPESPKFLLNNIEITQPAIRDTLELKNLHQHVYYWVTTRDFSQNESFYSDHVSITIPNVFPPTAARITHIESEDANVGIYYDRSPSDNAVGHILQRMSRSTKEWENIPLFPEDWNNHYIDTTVARHDTIEYRIIVVDENGLSSQSNIRRASVLESIMLPGFEYVKAEDRDSVVIIYFDYQNAMHPRTFRLMGGTAPTNMQTLSIMDAGSVALQEGILKKDQKDAYTLYKYEFRNSADKLRYFKIKAVSESGKVSPFSQIFSY